MLTEQEEKELEEIDLELIDREKVKDDPRFGICESCGKVFRQRYRSKLKTWTKLKRCPNCILHPKEGKVVTAKVKYTPHPGQELIHASNARYKVIVGGARWGKDRCSINEFIKKFAEMLSEDRPDSLVPKTHGWLVAPTFPMARQLWRELKYFFPREWITHIYEQDKIIETINGGVIEVKSADDPQQLVTVGLDIVVITEAARIRDLEEVWGNIYSRLQSPNRGPNGSGGLAIINSSPRGRNYFYELYLMGQDREKNPDWESWQFPTWLNPHIKPEEVEKAKKSLPERIFRQEWAAEFLNDGGEVFINVDAVCKGIQQDPEPGVVYTAAWDPAKEQDYSAFGIRDDKGQMVHVERWTGMPWVSQLDRVEYLCKKYNFAKLIMDRTGLGETLPEAVKQRGVEVEGVYISNALKEQMVSHLSLLMEQKAIVLLDDKWLKEELKAFTYKTTKTGKISYSAPKSMHDDLVTICMLLYKDFQDLTLTLSPYMGLLLGGKPGRIA